MKIFALTPRCSFTFYKTKSVVNNAVFWDVTPCDSRKNRGSEGRIAFIIRMERISDLRTTLAVTNNCEVCFSC
jgi:hypothetical protein